MDRFHISNALTPAEGRNWASQEHEHEHEQGRFKFELELDLEFEYELYLQHQNAFLYPDQKQEHLHAF